MRRDSCCCYVKTLPGPQAPRGSNFCHLCSRCHRDTKQADTGPPFPAGRLTAGAAAGALVGRRGWEAAGPGWRPPGVAVLGEPEDCSRPAPPGVALPPTTRTSLDGLCELHSAAVGRESQAPSPALVFSSLDG